MIDFNRAGHLPSPFTVFPPEVLADLDQTFWNYNSSKFSYPELSHRSEHYANINQAAQEHIRAYYSIPKDYHILFLPNETVFAAIPFNLNRFVNNSAIYLADDQESELAYTEALKTNPKAVRIGNLSQRKEVAPNLSDKPYYYYTFYNKASLESGELQEEVKPLDGEILVCNLNYCAHYAQVNMQKHGVVFFESGRGIGLTGLSVVIVRKDLVGFQLDTCPDMMCFEKAVTANSIINTPYTLVPLMLEEYLGYCDRTGRALRKVQANLHSIKQEYINALQQKTKVVDTKGAGIIKFSLPDSVAEQTWRELGWKVGEYMVIMLQEANAGKSEEFVNRIFT